MVWMSLRGPWHTQRPIKIHEADTGGKWGQTEVVDRTTSLNGAQNHLIFQKAAPDKTNMGARKFIWLGMFVGSTIAGFIPTLWGAGLLSMSGFFCSGVGGLAGIWLGYRVANSL